MLNNEQQPQCSKIHRYRVCMSQPLTVFKQQAPDVYCFNNVNASDILREQNTPTVLIV